MARSTAIEEAYALLELPLSAHDRDVMEARRRLAKRWHPDVGGSEEQMQELNLAVAVVMRSLAGQRAGPGSSSSPDSGQSRRTRPTPERPLPGRARSDHPSFTIDVAPWQAAVGVLEAARGSGRVVADELPHDVDVVMTDPVCWVRLALAPEGASTVVSLTVAPIGHVPAPDLDAVRDIWIASLNQLDWDRIAPQPPS